MRKFWDERGSMVTEEELREYFIENQQEYHDNYGENYSFEDYIDDCTDKNGTLEEIK